MAEIQKKPVKIVETVLRDAHLPCDAFQGGCAGLPLLPGSGSGSGMDFR